MTETAENVKGGEPKDETVPTVGEEPTTTTTISPATPENAPTTRAHPLEEEEEQEESTPAAGTGHRVPSPQPWDLVDPPADNNTNNHDYYSTADTKTFMGMQQSARRSPIPRSTYYFGPPPLDSAFGTDPVGTIGLHHPREIVRIERDYAGGELIQFQSTYPLELESRITPTHFIEAINSINELFISAHSIPKSAVYNVLAVVTLQISRLLLTSHYDKEIIRLEKLIAELNKTRFNPCGLNILSPRKVAFLFMEIEFY